MPPAASEQPFDPETGSLEGTDAVERLMIACLDLPAAERRAALERASLEHPELEARLRQRLAALERLGILPAAAGVAPDPFPERLGDFRLLERLGGGGMGVVYRARQESLEREVALKLIRPELLYFAGARARFHREAAAIARLTHSGIVPIHCSGEEEGVPYFAMELIEGCTLADALRALAGRKPESLTGRDLEQAIRRATPGAAREPGGARTLFEGGWVQVSLRIARQVAEALAHAHERGVLHRDVKPSNVVVTPAGRVALIDFGVASLSDAERVTRTGSELGSLPYMPPEAWAGAQVEGARDPRSDVYALGVTLYELLTLHLPFADASAAGLRVAIEGGRFTPLRARNHAVPWDAETVCTTAFDADPARRYAGAGDFARDLANVLELRPIEARRPTAALRARRWVQRHPTRSTALALGLLALLVGPSAAAIVARRSQIRIQKQMERAELAEQEAVVQRERVEAALREADDQRNRALLEKRDADEVAGFMLDLFATPDPDQARGHEPSARELLASGVRRIETELVDQPAVRARLLQRMGRSYASLGLHAEAEPLLERAIELQRGLFGERDLATIESTFFLARSLRLAHRAGAVPLLWRALEVYEELVGPDDEHTLDVLVELAAALAAEGQPAEARALLEQAFERTGADAALPGIEEKRASVLANLAFVLLEQRDFSGAAARARESVEGYRRLHPGPHPATVAALNTLGLSLKCLGRIDEADSIYRELLQMAAELYDPDSDKLAVFHANYGRLLEEQGRLDDAECSYRTAVAIHERSAEPEGEHAGACRDHLGDVRAARLDWAGACELYDGASAALRAASGRGAELAWTLQKLARCQLALGKPALAEASLREALALRLAQEGAGSARAAGVRVELANALRQRAGGLDEAAELLAEALPALRAMSSARAREATALGSLVLGCIAEERGAPDEARERFQEALEAPVQDPAAAWIAGAAESGLGACAAGAGDHQAAERLLLDGHAALVGALGSAHAETQKALRRLIALCEASGRLERAGELRVELERAGG